MTTPLLLRVKRLRLRSPLPKARRKRRRKNPRPSSKRRRSKRRKKMRKLSPALISLTGKPRGRRKWARVSSHATRLVSMLTTPRLVSLMSRPLLMVSRSATPRSREPSLTQSELDQVPSSSDSLLPLPKMMRDSRLAAVKEAEAVEETVVELAVEAAVAKTAVDASNSAKVAEREAGLSATKMTSPLFELAIGPCCP